MKRELGGLEVAVVDDDAGCLSALQHFLEAAGASVRAYIEPVRFVGSPAPDVLLTDFHMPVMDGISLMRRAHEEGMPYGRMILSSGSDPDEYLSLLPADATILPKPVALADLIRTVRAVHEKPLRDCTYSPGYGTPP